MQKVFAVTAALALLCLCVAAQADNPSAISSDTTGTITINSDAESTNSTAVTLTISASDPDGGVSQMRFSNDCLNWTDWEAYATTKAWTLESGEGFKTVYAEFKDGAGNVSDPVSDFIKLDTTAPTVSMTVPAVGDTNAPVTGIIMAVFSDWMDTASLTTTTFTLKDSANNAVDGTVSASEAGATLTPSVSLVYDMTYTATITTGARDIAGNPLSSDYSWSFSTMSAPTARLHVKTTGSDSNDGTAWSRAKRTMMGAMNAASSGTEIWVAKGTYVQPGGIAMKSGVALYGGFPAAGGYWSARNLTTNETILDGNHAVTVVTIPENAPATTVVDGFTVQNGSASSGGGILCTAGSSATISHNIIKSNTATECGGGIVCWNCSPTILANTITGNSALGGAGVSFHGESSPLLAANVIAQNTTSGSGGGVYFGDPSFPRLVSNTIRANTTTGSGGGVCSSYSSPVLRGNLVEDNTASSGGGLGFHNSSGGTIAGNTIRRNIATGSGGGIECQSGSSPTITGNRVSDNGAQGEWSSGGGINCGGNSSPQATSNTISGNTAYIGAGVSIDGGSAVIEKNSILSNEATSNAGGGVRGVNAVLDVRDNLIRANTAASGFGGGVMANECTGDISGNVIDQNTGLDGGGVLCVSSGPNLSIAVSDNSIVGNTSLSDDGGGVKFWSCDLSITGNRIVANAGGGISFFSASASITDNVVDDNHGTGIGVAYSSTVIRRNLVLRNGGAYGGGIKLTGCADATVEENTICDNEDGQQGGGGAVFLHTSSPVIRFNTIVGNSSTSYNGTGGVHCWASAPTIDHNIIAGNACAGAEGAGGMAFGECPSAEVTGNTLVGNAGQRAGAIWTWNSSPTVSSNIVAYCSSGITKGGNGYPWLNNNCVYGNTAYDYGPGVFPGYQDISVDPLFVNKDVGDYRLRSRSPCIDAGDESAELDPDGTRADIGALPYFHLGAARSIADGQAVKLSSVVATVGSNDGVGSLCFQDVTNPAGMWVQLPGSGTFSRGGTFDVAGTMAGDPATGERRIANPTITPTTAETPPKSLFLINRSLGGGPSGLQPGITGGSGLNNFGLLVTACGRVTEIDSAITPTWFKISDGSEGDVKVKVPPGVSIDPGWQFVRVTGISSCEKVETDLRRLVWVRDQSDVLPM